MASISNAVSRASGYIFLALFASAAIGPGVSQAAGMKNPAVLERHATPAMAIQAISRITQPSAFNAADLAPLLDYLQSDSIRDASPAELTADSVIVCLREEARRMLEAPVAPADTSGLLRRGHQLGVFRVLGKYLEHREAEEVEAQYRAIPTAQREVISTTISSVIHFWGNSGLSLASPHLPDISYPSGYEPGPRWNPRLGPHRPNVPILESSASGAAPPSEAARPPWHRFLPGDRISFADFDRLFGEKYVMRRVLDGGPIDSVRPYFATQVDPRLFDQAHQRREDELRRMLVRSFDDFDIDPLALRSLDGMIDRSVMAEVADPSGTLPLSKMLERIAEGEIDFPIVFKRNFGGVGTGIVFIEPARGGKIKVTLSQVTAFIDLEQWAQYLEGLGFKVIQKQNIAFRFVDRKDSPGLLRKLFEKITTMDSILYDSGMWEAMIYPLVYKGMAYETRHYILGRLGDGGAELLKSHPLSPKVKWFARLGSSRYLSNFSGRAAAIELAEPEMYDPLFDLFRFSASQKSSFIPYVEDIVLEETMDLLGRYRDGGFSLSNVLLFGPIDLVWPRYIEPNGFPRPIVMEADLKPILEDGRSVRNFPGSIEVGPVKWLSGK